MIGRIMATQFGQSWKVNLKREVGALSSPDASTTVDTFIWVIQVVCILCSLFLFYQSAKLFSDNNYHSGALTIAAATICGMAPFLALIFLK